MRKSFLLLLIAVATCLNIQALTVENTAGNLAQLVTDTQITQLTVTGTMDARDFLFISDELKELTAVDLSQVTIVPFNTGKALYGTVTKYNGNEIPRTAFFGKKLTSLALPAGVKTIGFAAFAGCRQLSSVTLPASVTYIDDYAFAGSALTSIDLPANINGMGKGVFSRCEALQSANINAKFIGDFAFLGDFELSNVTVGPNVEYILKGVFNGCTALQNITFDPSCRLSRIDEEAFINSGLENIDVEALGVATIGEWAFAQTRLSSFSLPNGMTELGEGALAHNPLLASVIFPGPDHSNGNGGRSNGLNSGSLRAPSRYRTLADIKDYTFAGDSLLNPGMMLKEGVNTIGNYAFYNVSNEIDTMRLPSSINYLGDYAMAGMTGMQVLKTDAVEVPSLGENVWAGVDQQSVPLITVSTQVEDLYKEADQWMNFYFMPHQQVLMGDVNSDGFVDVNDVTSLILYVLNGEGDIDLVAADIAADGSVDVNDITALINMVLSGSASKSVGGARAAAKRFVTTIDGLSFQQSTLRAGQTAEIEVALENSEHNYTAMQFDLVLPQGVTLVAVNGVDRGSEHNYHSIRNEIDNNAYSVMGVSMDFLDYPGEEGNVLSFTLSADDDFDVQDAQLVLTNVILATRSFESFLSSDVIVKLNNGSGIEDVKTVKEIASVRYINVAGQESKTPFSGMNIVVTTYTDGTTTSVKVIK